MKKSAIFLLTAALSLSACTDTTTSHENSFCQTVKTPFAHTRCTITTVDGLALHWQNDEHTPFYTFDNLLQKDKFDFMMNAGMYDRKFAPIGYTVIDYQLIKTLNTNEGEGNFHLMPNGVFWWDDKKAWIDTTPAFHDKLTHGIAPKYATQSGPMLVINGQIHPKFDHHSTSYKIRNGVGVDCMGNQIHFIISDETINFYQFADLFKNKLGCQNALFLDGGIASALYAKNLNRHDKLNMAVMITFKKN